ncbi:MAG: sulfite exporter TauE/SafE family protein [Clostridium sp.]
MSNKSLILNVDNMVCNSCENIIKKHLKKLSGIIVVTASYNNGTVSIEYDAEKVSYSTIVATIEKAGYKVTGDSKNSKSEFLPIVGIVLIALLMIRLGKGTGVFDMSSALSSKVSYIALFTIGVLTSLHCVGMCGGIMMSQSITSQMVPEKNKFKPGLMYNLGRLISYTILGGIVGGIGEVFTLSFGAQGLIAIIVGIFMVIMGLNLYGFKAFRKFSVKLPWNGCNSQKKSRNPLIVGLLNGFMPCGPLQTMQLYALASGSVIAGATSMFFFALGTIPLMLGFGVIANLLSQKNSNRLVKYSGAIIIVLGIIMANRGLSLMGINAMPNSLSLGGNNNSAISEKASSNKATISNGKQTIKISATNQGYTPSIVYVQKGVPTEFIVDGESINFCNNKIVIPSMNIQKSLSSGENIIEFTPEDKDINYSCWMGMLRGTIKVVDDLNSVDDSTIQNDIDNEFYYPSKDSNNQNFNGGFSCH